MERLRQFILFILIYLRCFYCSQLNIVELQEAVYDVRLDEIPLGFDENGLPISDQQSEAKKMEENKENNVIMTTQYGQKFICTLPVLSLKKVEAEIVSDQQELPANTVAKVVSAGFYMKKCTKREIAWWTYEVCYGSEIKQYHVEVTGTVTSTMSLGFFTRNMDIPSFKPKPDRPLYFEQQYSNGTICDLTGRPRTTVVRYYCEQLLETSEVFIDEVDESSTCEYIISIKTGSLCKLGPFLPVGRHQDPVGIYCRPWLQGDQVYDYVTKKENEKKKKKVKERKIDLLYRKALSIQRQRYSRRRLALKESRTAKKANLIDKRLKKLYETLVREAWRLNSELSNSQQKDVTKIILDDFGDAEEAYYSTKDQERGDVYWYFRDPYWDKSYFPPTFAYVRSLNKFYKLLDSDDFLLDKIGDKHSRNAFTRFLQQIQDGVITEADLSNLLGPLSAVFEENRIPTVHGTLNLEIENGDDTVYLALQKLAVERHLKPFENRVIESIVNGDRFAPKTVMSKVARDLLSLRNLQDRFYKFNQKDPSRMPASYASVEKVFKMYQDAYNRAVKRFDCGDYDVDPSGNIVNGPGVPEESEETKPKAMNPENAKLLYHDELAHELHEVFPSSESGAAWEENRAQNRMARRAKRYNLRKLVEEYFRKPNKEELVKELPFRPFLRKKNEGIKVMKDLFKKLLRGTGVPEEADVTVHLVTADGDVIGTSAEDSKIANLVKAWLEEQTTINDEIDHHHLLNRAYSFGATRKQKEMREQHSETRRSDLPIIREFL